MTWKEYRDMENEVEAMKAMAWAMLDEAECKRKEAIKKAREFILSKTGIDQLASITEAIMQIDREAAEQSNPIQPVAPTPPRQFSVQCLVCGARWTANDTILPCINCTNAQCVTIRYQLLSTPTLEG